MGSKSPRNTVFGLAASNYPYFDPSPDSLLPKMAERPQKVSGPLLPKKLRKIFEENGPVTDLDENRREDRYYHSYQFLTLC